MNEFAQAGPTFNVNLKDDHDDGFCGTLDCTLAEAISSANNHAGTDTITFAPNLSGTIELNSALPTIATNMNLQGPGANVLTMHRNATENFRIFLVTNGTTTGPVVSMSGLTLTNGQGTGSPVVGGAIVNDHGNLTLNKMALVGNSATNGGAIYNNGTNGGSATLTLVNCTVSGNSGNFGAALQNHGFAGSATALITNCTFSGNTASSRGAAVHNLSGNGGTATVQFSSCTITDNSALLGGIYNDGNSATGTVTLANTLLKAGAQGGNIANANGGTTVSQGYNLSSDAAGGPTGAAPGGLLNQTGDIRNTDPSLGPLADNGGPTLTHLPLSVTSPVVDKGKSFGLTTDQRGEFRLLDSAFITNAAGGDGADIGAVEYRPSTGPDLDGDGMSNDFELFYGFNPGDPADGASDSDGDGMTNAQEAKAGTNPRDPNSNLRVITAAKNGNDFSLTFGLAVIGKSYRLERKDALTDTMWSSINGVSDFTPMSTGSGQIADPGGASSIKYFYRVRLFP
jgi:hypothetical protein